MNESSNVTLELPQEFKERKINPTFHTNLVWPYIKNDDILFPKRDTKVFYDFGNDEDQEWLVEEILAHNWTNNNLELQVKWTLGDVTWEPLSSCKDLEALDVYLELQGAKAPQDLSQCEQIQWIMGHMLWHARIYAVTCPNICCDMPRYMLWHARIYAVIEYVTQLKTFSMRWLDNNHQGFSRATTTVHLGVL